MLDAKRRIPSGIARDALARILANRDGSMLPIFAMGTLILAALTGGGVDMARGYKAERRMQAACDAGVLAARRVVNDPSGDFGEGFSTEVRDEAARYFRANFDAGQHSVSDAVFTPSSEDDGNTIDGVVSGKLHTMIVAAFGFDEIELSVSCTASLGVGNSDIMFVLDNTGSMAWTPSGNTTSNPEATRIFALQEAMRDFYETVEETMAGGNTRVRYGFVPYSSSVRVGQLIHDLDPSYLRDSITVPSLSFVNWNTTTPVASGSDTNFSYSSANYTSWTRHSSTQYNSSSTCNANKPADTAWTNNGPPTMVIDDYSIKSDNGNRIKEMDMKQPQTMTDYECRQSSSRWYIDRRTGSRERTNGAWEEQAPIPVTTSNAQFTNAVLHQRSFSTSAYKNFNSVTLPIGINRSVSPNRTSNITSTWQGCISERDTVTDASFSFVSLLTGITPGGALDLDIDSAPNSDASRWSPLWPELGYLRDAADVAYDNLDENDYGESGFQVLSSSEISDNKAGSACPFSAQLFEEMSSGEFNNYVDNLTPTGGTYHDIGLLWGARLSSPTGMWSSLVNEEPSNGGSVSRHVIFMTDGELDPDRETYTAYGIEISDHRVTPTGASDSAQLSRHRSRYLAICEAIKARGIRLWVIAFGSTVSLSSDLTTCASPNSAFKAADAEQLNTHFQQIATQVGELRVTQ